MNKDFLRTLKKVLLTNIVIGGIAIAICFILFKKFTLVLTIGISVAIFSLILNGAVTHLFIGRKGKGNIPIYFFSVILRVFVVAIIGYIVFTYNKYNLIPYIIGYSLNLIGVGAYSVGANSLGEGE